MTRPLLFPLVPLYRVALWLRNLRPKTVRRLGFPVLSIGGLSAGGSGKTPTTIALAQALTGRGFSVDVLSRGYGRRSIAATRVDPDGSAEEFGDEPLLIAREAGVPVYVAAERYEAGLLAEAANADQRGTVVHLLDDGFQHCQLHRDVNILLLDARDFGDRLLPAGNLREPLSAMLRANIIAIPAGQPELEARLQARGWQGPVWHLKRRMEVPRVDGPVVAFCGIARPEQFFAGLESAGLHVASRIVFADHHRYVQHDLDCIQDAARSASTTTVVTTEKDRVRMGALGQRLNLKTAGLRIEIENEKEVLDDLVKRAVF